MRLSLSLPLLRLTVMPYDMARVGAVVACTILAVILNSRRGIPVRVTVLTALFCIPAAIWGARLLDVAEYGSEYSSLAAAVARNGSSIYGAFFGAFLVVSIIVPLLGVPLFRFLDGAAPALALGETITRIGCFFAGCCYGVPWNGPWALVFPAGSFAFYDLKVRGLLDASATETLPSIPCSSMAQR